MVPARQEEIPAATCRSIEHLLARLTRDRESLSQNGYGEESAPQALLNALADAADELKKAIASTDAADLPAPGPVRSQTPARASGQLDTQRPE